MPGRRGTIVLACAAALAMPAAAQADAFDQVLKEYQSTGTINPCKHSVKELEQAKQQMPSDIAQRVPGFRDLLDGALVVSRSGSCGQPTAATTTGTTSLAAPAATTQPPAATTQPPAATSTPAPQAALGPAAAQTADDGRSVPIGLIVVGAVLLAALALWGFARWWAWEPPWLVRWRHATAEAGWRASAAWAEFTDWLRLGR